jgi:hypothetical protein
MPRPQLADRAHNDLIAEPRAPQQPADAQLAGRARALNAVAPSDHHDPVTIGETALALAVGIAGKAAAATAALAGPVREAPDPVIRRHRPREAANPFPTRVMKRASDEEPHVILSTVGAARRHSLPGGVPT